MGKRDLKVGLFVLVSLLLSVMVIYMLGSERRVFDRSVEYKTSFKDVQGLKAGAPVRMGGIDVGQVTQVGYSKKDPQDSTIYVKFWVSTHETERVRTDTKARISTKGLLGDKMIELTKGQSDTIADPKVELVGEPGDDVMGRVNQMADKAEIVLDNIARVTEPLADEQLHDNIQGSVKSMRSILDEVAHGEGYPHKLLTDPDEAARISKLLDSFEKTSSEAQMTLQSTRAVVSRVQTGPGFAHDVLYGDGPKGLPEIASAANEVALTLKGVRESDSLLHDAMYGGKGDGAETIRNVTALTADLRAIVADVRAGKGTVGGLLVDPSIYEDVKVILGNVQRNDVLRSLVRYSINQDEKKTQVNVAGPR